MTLLTTRPQTNRNPSKILVILALFLAGIILAGCEPETPPPERIAGSALHRLRPYQYPAFFDDLDYEGLARGISRSLEYLRKLPADRLFWLADDSFPASHMIRTLEVFDQFIATHPPPEALNQFLEDNFRIYRSKGKDRSGEVLFTGYYEPFLEGRLTRSEAFPYPVYAMPKDLVVVNLTAFGFENTEKPTLVGRVTAEQKIIPYYDRQEINAYPLIDHAPPIAWVNDRIALFFMQIQGSGQIFLENENRLRVHYRITNGHPYRSIGALLIKEGKIPKEEMSMQRLRTYLQAHPGEIDDILNYNPSYVFFQLETGGPIGCYGVEVTAGRSLALQKRIFPAAALTFMVAAKPLVDGAGKITSWRNLRRFGLNQDTGGAIRGPGRADLFWGNGPYAEIAAGHMQHPGELYFLVLKPETE